MDQRTHRRSVVAAASAVVLLSCGSPDASVSSKTPFTGTAHPAERKTLQPVGAVACPIGDGSVAADCRHDAPQLQGAMDAAYETVIHDDPDAFDLTQEAAAGTRSYLVKDKDAFYAGVLDALRSAGYCADRNYTNLDLVDVKNENGRSEIYSILDVEGDKSYIWRGTSSYRKTCTPSHFPVAPDPDGPPPGSGCGRPYPPPIGAFGAKIYVRNSEYWKLDSTPLLIGRAVCAQMGFYDGRSQCPVRPEGAPDRVACENWRVGIAKDTGRGGPTWNRDGKPCTGPDSGCENDAQNQYMLRVYWNGGGDYHPCTSDGSVCGEVYVER